MQDYQGNADKQKKEKETPAPVKKDLEKVISGQARQRPAGPGSKFKNIFLGGDIQSVGQFIVADVLFPAIRDFIVDAFTKGSNRLVYGESGLRRRSSVSYQPRVQYNNPLHRQIQRGSVPDQNPSRWSTGRKPFEDIVLASKEDADALIENLTNVVDMYQVVSVADLFEMVGLPSSHIDNKWGWSDLRNIEVRQVREGWRVSFPSAEELS